MMNPTDLKRIRENFEVGDYTNKRDLWDLLRTCEEIFMLTPEWQELREKLTVAREALERAEKFASIVTDWDSVFPDGIEMEDDVWVRPYELLKEFKEALSKIRGSNDT
jgi:hypothetical protein